MINRLTTTLRRLVPVASMLVLAPATVWAYDLNAVFQLSQTYDAGYQAVIAEHAADNEAINQAYAALYPVISASADTTYNRSDRTGSQSDHYNSHGFSLSLTQPVFNWERIKQLDQAKLTVRQSRAELDSALHDLMVRTASRYFDLLKAKNNLEFAEKTKAAIARQLEQATQRFKVGLIAITDVDEAQARHDLAVADEIKARNRIEDAREALREITGEYISQVKDLNRDQTLINPEPDDIDAWTGQALEQNLSIRAASYGKQIAMDEIKRLNAQHYPTLNLVGSSSYTANSGGTIDASRADTIALQLAVPIFSGGATSSKVKEARFRHDQASWQLDSTRRKVQRQTREAFRAIKDLIATSQALSQALRSTQTALAATEAGYQAGTRTSVDVLDSQRDVFDASRNLKNTRYDYVINTLLLKQAAGTLSGQDIEAVNAWLK